MYLGEAASSPSTSRSCLMQSFSTGVADECRRPHRLEQLLFRDELAGVIMRCLRTAHGFGLSGIAVAPCQTHPLAASKRRPTKENGCVGSITGRLPDVTEAG